MKVSLKPVVVLAVFVTCVAVSPSVQAANDEVAPEHPTFTRDVLPILQRSCQVCHRPDMFTPMSLLTYDEVRPWARSITRRGARDAALVR